MKNEEEPEKVYNALVDTLRADRSKTTICKISELGLVEMTRKRVREPGTIAVRPPAPTAPAKGSSSRRRDLLRRVIGRSSGSPDPLRKQVSLYVHPALPRSCSARSVASSRSRAAYGMKVNISASDKYHIDSTGIRPS